MKISYEMVQEAITVPYPPLRDDIRNNRGFTDLRGNINAAETIFEGQQSVALQNLLVDLARPGSSLFTVGCDLGSHRQKDGPRRSREVAGGYVEVLATQYADVSPDQYQRFAEAIGGRLRAAAKADKWRLSFVLSGVQFDLDGFHNIVPSLRIWFWALSSTSADAVVSRERLITVLHATIAGSSVSKLLGHVTNSSQPGRA